MPRAPKKQTVQDQIEAHLSKIGECIAGFVELLEAYLAGESERVWELWRGLDALESEADAVRRSIIEALYAGAFLPLTREDIMRFVEAADQIADAAESASDELVLTQPSVPEPMRPELVRLAREAMTMLPELQQAAAAVFTDFSTAMAKAEEVASDETLADEVEWHLVRDLFARTDLDLGQKLHLRHIIADIGDIADRMEDAADRLEALLVKQPA